MPPKSFAGPIVATKDVKRPAKKKKREMSKAQRGVTTMTRFIKEFYGADNTSESQAPASATISSTPVT
jgi:hypothetical protein